MALLVSKNYIKATNIFLMHNGSDKIITSRLITRWPDANHSDIPAQRSSDHSVSKFSYQDPFSKLSYRPIDSLSIDESNPAATVLD